MPPPDSWLCPTDLDRARVLDSSARVRRARSIGAAAIGVALAVAAPWLGWGLLAIFAIVAIHLLTLDLRIRRAARPELTVASSLLFTEVAIGVGAAISGGAASPLLPWMAIPVGMTAARFRPAVVRGGLLLGILLTVAAAIAGDPSGVAAHPWLLVTTIVLEVNVVAIVAALEGAELQHRSESVLDPLTGLLNRNSLDARFAELQEQARQNDGPVSLIALDLDGFKAINDDHGHARGDAVLRDVSYEMRKTLRSFELFYRYGGEEFLVVLPGVESGSALRVAERLRAAVEEARPTGLDLSVSAGVAHGRGESVSLRLLFEAADDALYEAKRRGRNRVVAGDLDVAPPEHSERRLALAELSPDALGA